MENLKTKSVDMINHIYSHLLSRRLTLILHHHPLRSVVLLAGMANVENALIAVEERSSAFHAIVALPFPFVFTLLQLVLVVACAQLDGLALKTISALILFAIVACQFHYFLLLAFGTGVHIVLRSTDVH
jgi:hypothetical protein